MASFEIKDGVLTVYVNGAKTAINIEKDDTLGDLKSQLAAAGIKTEIDENGAVKFSAQNEGNTVNFGSTTDTSNFVSLTGLTKQEDGTYTRAESIETERAYSLATIKRLLEKTGFELLSVASDYVGTAPDPATERWYFIARAIKN